jgi:hypothetical protein
MGAQHAAGSALVQADLGADLAGDPGHVFERQVVQVVALAGERDEQVLLARLAVGAAEQWQRRNVGGGGNGRERRRRRGAFAAGCDRAFLDRPAPEPAQRAWPGPGPGAAVIAARPRRRRAGWLLLLRVPGRRSACGPVPRRGLRR